MQHSKKKTLSLIFDLSESSFQNTRKNMDKCSCRKYFSEEEKPATVLQVMNAEVFWKEEPCTRAFTNNCLLLHIGTIPGTGME